VRHNFLILWEFYYRSLEYSTIHHNKGSKQIYKKIQHTAWVMLYSLVQFHKILLKQGEIQLLSGYEYNCVFLWLP